MTTVKVLGNIVTLDTQASLTNQDQTFSTKSDVQDKIIEQDLHNFSTVEDSPMGLNTTLYNTIGPHGTTKFCKDVLKAQLTETDKENVEFVEAFELLQMIAH